MTVFLIGAALLIVAALVFLLPPLLSKEEQSDHVQRDQLNLAVLRDQLRELEADREAGLIEQAAYDSARRELERRVAEEVVPHSAPAAKADGKRWAAAVVGVVVPALSVAVYMLIGSPQGLDPATYTASAQQQDGGHEVTQEQIEGMVATLAQRMQDEPENVEGWNMLARSYNALGRFQQAADAYAHLVKLVPGDAGLLADYADALAMAQNRSLIGEPEKLAEQAVKADPQNIKALALWGSAAFERKDYAAAAERWQKLLAVVPPDSDIARSVSSNIAEAQGMMGKGAAPLTQQEPPKAAAASVAGVVDIDPALRAQVADGDTVFIFARAAEGPRAPLAVIRKQVKDLPASFVLDDTMSMTPDTKLSSVSRLVVGARVSKSGNAQPAPGDLEGASSPIAPGATNLKITINKKNG